MIPFRDVIPSRTTPSVTIALIAVNAAVFFFELSLSPAELRQVMRDFAVVPVQFDFVTVFPAMFLHAGWLHFAATAAFLLLFGPAVEDRMGHLRFAVFYLASGVAGTLVQVFFSITSTVPVAGASAAVSGVMGAYFALFPNSKILALLPRLSGWEVIEIPATFFLGCWFLVPMVAGAGAIARTAATSIAGVAFWGHIAGFAAGVAALFAFRQPERMRVEWWDKAKMNDED